MNKTGPCYGLLALPEPLDEGRLLVDDDRDLTFRQIRRAVFPAPPVLSR